MVAREKAYWVTPLSYKNTVRKQNNKQNKYINNKNWIWIRLSQRDNMKM